MTVSRRLFQRVHFTASSCRTDASRSAQSSAPSQQPRRNAFAVREMSLMRKSEPRVQRPRRRAFDSTSKGRRVSPGRYAIGFAFAELARQLKCGPVRLLRTGLITSDVVVGLLALPLHSVLNDGNQFN